MPKINGNEIKPGNVLEHDNGLWAAVKVEHVKPGKGGAFAQVELKNLRTGSKLNERFRSADKVERVRLEQKDQQFLYEADGMLVFMDVLLHQAGFEHDLVASFPLNLSQYLFGHQRVDCSKGCPFTHHENRPKNKQT